MHSYNILNVSFTAHLQAIIMQLSNNNRTVYLNGPKVTTVRFLILSRPVSRNSCTFKGQLQKNPNPDSVSEGEQAGKGDALVGVLQSLLKSSPLSSLTLPITSTEYAAARQKY